MMEFLQMWKMIIRGIVGNIYLRFVFIYECEKLKIDIHPRLVLGCGLPGDTAGLSYKKNRRVAIDLCKPASEWHGTLVHELRHIWQYDHYEDIVEWCHKYMSQKGRTNDDYYWFNPLEIDAYHYEINRDIYGPINDISVDQLENARLSGSLIAKMQNLALRYHVYA